MKTPRKPQARLPLFMALFISMFGFIGLAVVIFLWSQPSDDFGSPPLIFKLVGTFIGLAFMAMGFGLPLTAFLKGAGPEQNQSSDGVAPVGPAGYKCPHCGAGLGEQQVSPSGDVRCAYCDKWWNIHK